VPPLPDLHLTDDERAMRDGEAGPAARLAMRILVRVAPLYGASSLIEVTRAHIDGCIYEGEAGLAFAERLADLGGVVRVPTSLNVVSLDRRDWRSHGLPIDFAGRARRLADAYLRMGAVPSFTCAPYQTLPPPAFGEQIAWSESNAVAFANSVLGARTNRYGDYLDICCALAGRAPAAGLHLSENRQATIVVRLVGIPPALLARDDFYPVLGYRLGAIAGDEIPAVVGLDARPTEDQLKALFAGAASSGSIALAHLVGVTPEAPTLAAALGGSAPNRTIDLTLADLRAARGELSTARDGRLGAIAFGSPHCSLAECRELARLMAGRRKADGVKAFVTTSRAVRDLLERDGSLATLRAFGATVTADTCIVVAPLLGEISGALMTNSAKYAHYGPGILGVGAVFGSTEACVASAIAGRVVEDDEAWMA
jgi:predicted aconitase